MPVDQAKKLEILAKMRKKQQEVTGSKDPFEWRAPKTGKEDKHEFRVIILPPLSAGDKCSTGEATTSMDMYFLQHGHHYINNKKVECPRVHIENGSCPFCEMGFDLMSETDDKEVRRKIAKEWLSQQGWAVNIYFLDTDKNPENLRGKVMWWSMPKTVWKLCEETLKSNDAGDEEEPKAYGLFFYEEEAFPLNIIVTHKNDNNSYDLVKFSGKARRLAKEDSDMQKILNARHDLFTKFGKRDIEVLKKLFDQKVNSSTDNQSEFDENNNNISEGKKETPKQEATKQEAPKNKGKDDDEDDDKPAPKKQETPKETPKAESNSEELDPELQSLINALKK